MQGDAPFDPRAAPVSPRHVRIILVNVARHELAVSGQRGGDADGAVAGENTDLEGAPRPEQLDQQPHELALLRRNLHSAPGSCAVSSRSSASTEWLPDRNSQKVIVQACIEAEGTCGHAHPVA